MTPFEIHYPAGATPLSPEERDGLIPKYITTHGELNELEQSNIQEAHLWVRSKKKLDVIDVSFLHELHKRMFSQVWKWAGRARSSGKNIGVDAAQIATKAADLIGDLKFWIENHTYSFDEIAARFHHRLVQIHIYPNGNGRHARLVTDLLLETNGKDAFSWGANASKSPLETEGERRNAYIAALKAADRNDYSKLLVFVRS